ncbi:MAG TPA: hypothetical protein VNZ58_12180, partial [Thermomicrobiales bacterium]|nr:hypothetical protein [Thermomicrobiales bacterium]
LGAWLDFAGIGLRAIWMERIGIALALAGAVLFMFNVASLFHQKAHTPPPTDLHPDQAAVDKVGIGFTKLSASWLIVGLLIGVILSWWQPSFGRWDLVWAHAMLVGWFMTMAGGVSYHVLPRWTGVPWRSTQMVRLHYQIVTFGLPFMVLALATGWQWLFFIAGPLQALAILVFLVNVAPMVVKLTGPVRLAIAIAAMFLIVGLSLGVMFAVDASTGPRLRQVHVMANVFGWAGLLISGYGYQFVPAFSGRRLIWPRLATIQIGVMVVGVLTGMYAMWARMFDGGSGQAVTTACIVVAAGLVMFVIETAATFLAGRVEHIQLLSPTGSLPRITS